VTEGVTQAVPAVAGARGVRRLRDDLARSSAAPTAGVNAVTGKVVEPVRLGERGGVGMKPDEHQYTYANQ
jgi:hypothetical protein